MSCRTNRSSVTWGADLARTVARSVPPATSPECRAMVADAEAAARYVASVGMKIRAATVAESDAARYALPTGATPSDMYVPVGPWVDIYLSAGPNDENGSCDVGDDSNCRLYRVRWNLVAGTAYEVAELTPQRGPHPPPGYGDVQPALSPDERSLAWIRRNGSSSKLLRQSHGEAGPTLVYEGTNGGEDRPQFPNWVSDGLLAFHTKSAADEDTVWYAVFPSAPVRFVGPGAFFHSDASFGDVDTHQSPGYRSVTGARIVTHGGADGQKIPHVTDLVGGESEPFELGFGGADAMCHHAAWNTEGTRILCHAASEAEPFGIGQRLHALYEYRYLAPKASWVKSDTSAGPDGRVFDPADPAMLDEVLSQDALVCATYFVKYAEWCGSDDYVLATLYCKDENLEIPSSRVVVVTLRGPDGAAQIADVTSAVEEALSDAMRLPPPRRRPWRAVFGTCSRPRQSPLWAPAVL